MILQEAMDSFVLGQMRQDAGRGRMAEGCMEALADYLLHFSDLFQDDAEQDEGDLAEWEQALEANMEQLFDGDVEPTSELGGLEVSQLDAEHLRDFLGWYLMREVAADSTMIRDYCEVLRAWLDSLSRRRWLTAAERLEFLSVVDELEPACVRAAKAAQLLFHFVRLGSGVAPRLRGQRFSEFAEGHARLVRIEGQHVWLQFDNHVEAIGPLWLAEEIVRFLEPGDVIDVELGLRGDTWLMVDVGPVYPSAVYVDAEALHAPDKIT